MILLLLNIMNLKMFQNKELFLFLLWVICIDDLIKVDTMEIIKD